MPLYRDIMKRRDVDLQVVVAVPTRDVGVDEYLRSHGVRPDGVVAAKPGELPVSSPPTLLLTDDSGVVTHAWVGVLDSVAQDDLATVLFGEGS